MDSTKCLIVIAAVLASGALAMAHGEKRQDAFIRPAFSAGLTVMTNVSDHVNVTFDRVFLNTGNNYDSSTGEFTAPYNGTYWFAYHALAENDGQLWLHLYVNNKYYSSAYAHISAQYGAASNNAVITLSRGDIIHVMGRGDSILYGQPDEVYSTFSGYLMYYQS